MSETPSRAGTLLLPGGLALALLLHSFRGVWSDLGGRFLGRATDTIHHAWALWWAAQPGGEGALSTLVSFPTGERGALLSPLTTAGSRPWLWMGGPGLAYNAACIGVLAGAMCGVGLLTARLARDTRAGLFAAVALLVGRPMYAHLGLGLMEGMSIGWVALACWALLIWVEGDLSLPAAVPVSDPEVAEALAAPKRWRRAGKKRKNQDETPDEAPSVGEAWERRLWSLVRTIVKVLRDVMPEMPPFRHPAALLAGLACAVAVLENPYALILVAPAALIGAVARLRRGPRWPAAFEVASAAMTGTFLIAVRLFLARGDLGGNLTTAVNFRWLGRTWSALEGEGSYAISQILSPFPVIEFAQTAAEIRETGGDVYLGWTALGLALVGVRWGGRAARVAAGVALLCGLLALGSLPNGQEGGPGLFFFVNLALSQVLPPLTQPVRFLVLAQGALAVAGALGLSGWMAQRPADWTGARSALLALFAEAVLLGGPALGLPTTELRPISCFSDLGALNAGAVHMVTPTDWTAEQANTAALKFQLIHRLPGTHHGIGGWTGPPRDQRFDQAITQVTNSLSRPVLGTPAAKAAQKLASAGLAWFLVPAEQAPSWAGQAAVACDGWAAYPISTFMSGSR